MTHACFYPADISLPDFKSPAVDGCRWSCVACDQYTSQPEYWEAADRLVGDAPSTLRLILPEVYLEDAEARIPAIRAAMNDYLQSILVTRPDSMIYVERTLADGSLRRGLVGMVDLAAYDYRPGSDALIRATEKTVPERVPPRMVIRQGAPVELPHVMLLIDDRARTVIEPLTGACTEVAYDHDLMQNSGHIKGYWVDKDVQTKVLHALDALITPEAMTARYGREGLAPLLFAVGDGNHSLAAAKACYDAVVAEIGVVAAATHPARYALAEVVNLYDDSLNFEPIYRVIFGVDPASVTADFKTYAAALSGDAAPQSVRILYGGTHDETVTVPSPVSGLAVGTVQQFLDAYLPTLPGASVDYIHGEDVTAELSARPGAIAFLYNGMEKEELFSTVISDGSLPRKTFSMGHAADKRFYTEVRKIR